MDISKIGLKIRTTEPQPNYTGSYKKKRVVYKYSKNRLWSLTTMMRISLLFESVYCLNFYCLHIHKFLGWDPRFFEIPKYLVFLTKVTKMHNNARNIANFAINPYTFELFRVRWLRWYKNLFAKIFFPEVWFFVWDFFDL